MYSVYVVHLIRIFLSVENISPEENAETFLMSMFACLSLSRCLQRAFLTMCMRSLTQVGFHHLYILDSTFSDHDQL